jgi:hypothetical protein
VGSGTTAFGSTDAEMDTVMVLSHVGTNFAERLAGHGEVSGLTAGDTYNVQMMCRAPDALSHWLYKFIKVIPDL